MGFWAPYPRCNRVVVHSPSFVVIRGRIVYFSNSIVGKSGLNHVLHTIVNINSSTRVISTRYEQSQLSAQDLGLHKPKTPTSRTKYRSWSYNSDWKVCFMVGLQHNLFCDGFGYGVPGSPIGGYSYNIFEAIFGVNIRRVNINSAHVEESFQIWKFQGTFCDVLCPLTLLPQKSSLTPQSPPLAAQW